jgi:tRNA G18 (ribose-2'-O)-methylase SpoU
VSERLLGRGFFGIGIERSKTPMNVGTLWRSAGILGAAFIFTVGHRYPKQASDTIKAWRHIPLWTFDTLDDLYEHLPFDCQLVGVEMDDRASTLAEFKHPERACYLLGAEDHGLTRDALDRCHRLVKLPGLYSLNVAVAGSIVLYDRIAASPVAFPGERPS